MRAPPQDSTLPPAILSTACRSKPPGFPTQPSPGLLAMVCAFWLTAFNREIIKVTPFVQILQWLPTPHRMKVKATIGSARPFEVWFSVMSLFFSHHSPFHSLSFLPPCSPASPNLGQTYSLPRHMSCNLCVWAPHFLRTLFKNRDEAQLANS